MPTKKQLEAEHKYFLDKFPEYLLAIGNLIGNNTLTYHPDEIHQVELLYNSLSSKSPDSETDAAELDNIFVCYFGSAFIHYFGGEWLKVTGPKNIFHGLSVVRKYGGKDYRWIAFPPSLWLKAINKGDLTIVSDEIKQLQVYFSEHPEYGIEVKTS